MFRLFHVLAVTSFRQTIAVKADNLTIRGEGSSNNAVIHILPICTAHLHISP